MVTSSPRGAVRSARRPARARWIAIAVVALLAIAAAVAALVVSLQPRVEGAPGPGTVVLASEQTKAAEAAASEQPGSPAQDAAAYLAAQPTAYWLVPEADPVGAVGDRIAQLAVEARAQSARLAVVVYGLPGRDCGNYSAGGLDPAAYADWTAEIGTALASASDVSPLVILEPDSLALAPDCGNLGERAGQLSDAIDALASEQTWIYLDGGHSNWRPADEMASIMRRVGGLERVRGFATNVSNYNATADEVRYAHALSKALGGRLRAVIDTSRNGAGSTGEWCNPPDRLVGEPGGTIGDDVVDTNLWIKPPGESDGTCNGGPVAGAWWPDAAVELTRSAATR